MKIHNLITLEFIRRVGSPPYPLTEEWEPLREQIEILVEEELLSIGSTTYEVTSQGKKVILILNDNIKDFLATYEKYRGYKINGLEIDARIPVFAFQIRGKAEAQEWIEDFSARVLWLNYFEAMEEIVKRDNWQRYVLGTFDFYIKKMANVDAWRMLGRSEEEALRAGALLTSGPNKRKDLVQIRRNDGREEI